MPLSQKDFEIINQQVRATFEANCWRWSIMSCLPSWSAEAVKSNKSSTNWNATPAQRCLPCSYISKPSKCKCHLYFFHREMRLARVVGQPQPAKLQKEANEWGKVDLLKKTYHLPDNCGPSNLQFCWKILSGNAQTFPGERGCERYKALQQLFTCPSSSLVSSCWNSPWTKSASTWYCLSRYCYFNGSTWLKTTVTSALSISAINLDPTARM